ncbi:response regulator transcription factor [Rhizobium sp. P32RR-XVIII]|uniref:winged helix-turn-helix transcriptional regulator n=1 Tax=Rhizobium sp. P32RR-XVIII TaxID=2726738 RepID=UPI001456B205|nr:response regulator transcription factor [Rhizobium sp. P32RR-XVIII]NLS07186.1 response regulator transcription factor [Rhizobium sp. P32RR-XVIII]
MSFQAKISTRCLIQTGIAILSEDADYYLMLSHVLATDGYPSLLADGVETAIALIAEGKVAAVLVDCQPGSTVLSELSLRVRQESLDGNVLIIALVAGGVPFIDVLKSGADENFIRPLKPSGLLSYLHSRLGEGSGADPLSAPPQHPGLRLDPDTRQAFADGSPVGLSPIEFRILSALMTTPGRVFTRLDLIEAVWPAGNFVDPRTVDVHVARLRRSLRKALGRDMIRTVRGEGYAVKVT